MAEAIVIDRVSRTNNWDEVCRDLHQEAAIRQLPVEELIKEILKADGYEDAIDVDRVNWSCLMDGEDPDIDESEEE